MSKIDRVRPYEGEGDPLVVEILTAMKETALAPEEYCQPILDFINYTAHSKCFGIATGDRNVDDIQSAVNLALAILTAETDDAYDPHISLPFDPNWSHADDVIAKANKDNEAGFNMYAALLSLCNSLFALN